MRVELDVEEAWSVMSYVVKRLVDEAQLTDEDRARIRRWRSEQMRPTDDAMQLLTGKINQDLAHAMESKRRSQIRKPDWV